MVKPQLFFREAEIEDLPRLIALLADDELGQKREKLGDVIDHRYIAAFQNMAQDPNNHLIVVWLEEEIVGMLQLTFIEGLSRLGSTRGQIEAVRVANKHRGKGIGSLCFQWAIEKCRQRGCDLVQLTSDKSRTNAQRFYKNLGFKSSHIGYKLLLEA